MGRSTIMKGLGCRRVAQGICSGMNTERSMLTSLVDKTTVWDKIQPARYEPKWRNWQTRYVQGVVGLRSWGFKSLLRHTRPVKAGLFIFLSLPCGFLWSVQAGPCLSFNRQVMHSHRDWIPSRCNISVKAPNLIWKRPGPPCVNFCLSLYPKKASLIAQFPCFWKWDLVFLVIPENISQARVGVV